VAAGNTKFLGSAQRSLRVFLRACDASVGNRLEPQFRDLLPAHLAYAEATLSNPIQSVFDLAHEHRLVFGHADAHGLFRFLTADIAEVNGPIREPASGFATAAVCRFRADLCGIGIEPVAQSQQDFVPVPQIRRR
jgi:hypothetical protein